MVVTRSKANGYPLIRSFSWVLFRLLLFSCLSCLLRWSFFNFIYTRSTNMNYFIYTRHHFSAHGRYEPEPSVSPTTWPKETEALGTIMRSGQYLNAHIHITRVVAAMDSYFGLDMASSISARRLCHADEAITRPKQLSMAATARVIWLCACVRYWPDHGLVFECVTFFHCRVKPYITITFITAYLYISDW